MDITVLFYSEVKGSEKIIKKIVKNFKDSIKLYIADVKYEKVDDTENGEVWAIIARLNRSLIDESHLNDFMDAISNRLYVLGITAGLIPIDENGNILYLLKPYGFKVIFHNQQSGRKAILKEIVEKLCQEVPDNYDDGYIDEESGEGIEGAYYMVAMKFQDYLKDDDRNRLMLAFYFRLLMLAKKDGFIAIPQNGEN